MNGKLDGAMYAIAIQKHLIINQSDLIADWGFIVNGEVSMRPACNNTCPIKTTPGHRTYNGKW